jgi:hypothetical protein
MAFKIRFKRLGKRKGTMNVAPTLVVASKPKCNYKSKKENEKEA